MKIDRRSVLAGLVIVATSAWGVTHAGGCITPSFAADATKPLRLVSVKFGSVSWLIEIMRAYEIDKKVGLALEVVDVPSNQAGPVALLAGGADVIISDWTWAMRQRWHGEKLKFSPYSSSLGSLMVPNDSPIKSLSDLDGKTLGVAGSAIDKSWLLLRAYVQQKLGRDLSKTATVSFGAAPLLAEEIKAGRVNAVLNFWTFSARLQSAGFRPIIKINDVMQELGLDPIPPLVGFIWREEFEAAAPEQIKKLLEAARLANDVLKNDDAAWARIRPLVKPSSDEELKSIMDHYRRGIPHGWGAPETASAKKLMDVLIQAGDVELMGQGTQFDANLFHHAAS